MKTGSLCTGVGGIELGLGLDPVWVADDDKFVSKLIDKRFPGIPNLGDIKTINWRRAERVDILTAGYPCQPFSHAGLGQGLNDPRHIFPYIANAIYEIRPNFVILENVRGHLRKGGKEVLGELADLGYNARWGIVRASDAGAPHKRERIFIVAAHSQCEFGELLGELGVMGGPQGPTQEPIWYTTPDSHKEDSAYANSQQYNGGGYSGSPRWYEFTDSDYAFTNTPLGQLDEVDQRQQQQLQQSAYSSETFTWGEYEGAIRRWEYVLRRSAPQPLDDVGRLRSEFSEWMMGLPLGWVTDAGLSKTQELKAIGNAVCPHQARLAIEYLC